MSAFEYIIDRIKDGTNNAADFLGKTAKNAVNNVETKSREAKIRYAVKAVEARKKSNFAAIGASVYASFKGREEEKDFSEIFGRLDALEDDLAQLERELAEECNKVLCPSCRAAVSMEAEVCPKCGVRIKDEKFQ